MIEEKRKNQRSRRFLLAFTLFVTCCLLAWQFSSPLIVTLIKWRIGTCCQRSLGADFSCDEMHWDKGELTVVNASLQVPAVWHLDVPFAKCHFSLDWKRRLLKGEFFVDNPTLACLQENPFECFAWNDFHIPYFECTFKTHVTKGVVILKEQEIDCSLVHQWNQNGWEGTMQILEKDTTPVACIQARMQEELQLSISFERSGLVLAHACVFYCFPSCFSDPSLQWAVTQGNLSGLMAATFRNGHLLTIQGNAQGENLIACNKTLLLKGSASLITLSFDANASTSSIFHSWNSHFQMKNGEFSLLEQAPDVWKQMGPLRLKESEIIIREGQLERSSLHAKWLGMEGELFLNWLSLEELVHIQLEGHSQDIFPFLPATIQQGFSQAFPEDYFTVDASVKRGRQGIDLEGKILVSEMKGMFHSILFGCKWGGNREEEKIASEVSKKAEGLLAHLKNQFCLSKRRVGWFRGENLPLEKFLSPFLFQDIQLNASGMINAEGTFDERFLIVLYAGQKFILESPHFHLEASSPSDQPHFETVGIHCLDLQSFSHVGVLPLEDATYTQKNVGIRLTKGSTIAQFENHQILLKDIACDWNEINFHGEIAINIHTIEDVDLSITTHKVAAPLVQARDFFSHIIPSFFWKVPLEGEVTSGEGDVFLHFHFQPKAKLTEGYIRGELTTGFHAASVNLDNYRTSFAYDVRKNSLCFSNGHGELGLSNHPQEENFSLEIPELLFSELSSPQIAFEAHLSRGDNTQLSWRGHTEGDEQRRNFYAEGDSLFFHGVQEGSTVNVNAFEIGALKGNAILEMSDKGCRFHHLRLRYGELGAASIEGKIDWQSTILKGEMDHLIIDLNALAEVPGLPEGIEKWLSQWKPHGKLSGEGEIRWNLKEGEWKVETTSTFHELEFGGMRFGDGENLSCHFSSKQGLVIEGLEGEIPGEDVPLRYKLGKLHYHLAEQKVEFEAFDFSLPPDRLSWLTNCASLLFQGKIPPHLIDCVTALKQQEPFEGRVSVSLYPDHVWVYLTLKDGIYYLKEYPCNLHNFSLFYDSKNLQVEAACQIQRENYWMTLIADGQTMQQGRLEIREQPNALAALQAFWERDTGGFFHIHKVTGSACGIAAELASVEKSVLSDTLHYVGKIGIDAKRTLPFLSTSLQSWMAKTKVGRGYSFEGDFYVSKHDLSNVSFRGGWFGQNFEVGGMQIAALSSEAEYTPGHLSVHDLCIEDTAGQLFIEDAELSKEEDKWHLEIPHLRLNDFRLNRLKGTPFVQQKKGKAFLKSLIVPQLEIHDLTGILGEKETFLGSGAMQFTNLPPKNLVSNLLLIPTEITARIGLDLSLLVPVRGTIVYDIHDGKIHLKKLDQMYSEGKRSRFYLADGFPAYLDFDGSLNFKIKMKQYNLLMKLAEFFTITVKGNLLKPTYTFMNQFEEEDENGEEGS